MIVTDSSHLKKELTRLLRAVSAGEEVIVTYRGRRVARLLPYDTSDELIQKPRDPGAPSLGALKVRAISYKGPRSTALLARDRKRR